MSREAALLQGQNGYHVVNSGEGTVTGSFRWLHFATDTVLASLTDATSTNVNDTVGITHLAGTGIGGNPTSLSVTSGTVHAYFQ
jgi:hypothetical protein